MHRNLLGPYEHVLCKVGHALVVVLRHAIRLEAVRLALGLLIKAAPLLVLDLLVLLLQQVCVKHFISLIRLLD